MSKQEEHVNKVHSAMEREKTPKDRFRAFVVSVIENSKDLVNASEIERAKAIEHLLSGLDTIWDKIQKGDK